MKTERRPVRYDRKFYPESVMGEEVSFQLEVRQTKAWSKKERL